MTLSVDLRKVVEGWACMFDLLTLDAVSQFTCTFTTYLLIDNTTFNVS